MPQDLVRYQQTGYPLHFFNVYTEKKRVEKLRSIPRNPVTRGRVAEPEDWE